MALHIESAFVTDTLVGAKRFICIRLLGSVLVVIIDIMQSVTLCAVLYAGAVVASAWFGVPLVARSSQCLLDRALTPISLGI